jgi:hypothetical protein
MKLVPHSGHFILTLALDSLSEISTQVGAGCAFAACLTSLTRVTMRLSPGYAH